MGENNTIGLLTNINSSLNRIVQLMLPQNQDPKKAQESVVKNLSQGSLGSANTARQAADTSATGLEGVGTINVGQIVSALDSLPLHIKAIAKLSGRTIKNFSNVMNSILKIFTLEEFSKIDEEDITTATNLIKTLTELGKLPDTLKSVSKIKDKQVETFAKVVTKMLETVTKAIKETKVTDKDVKTAKQSVETIVILTTAVKSLAKMTLIAPLAMVGLIAITPVWLAFGSVLMLLGLLEKPLQKGIRALRGIDRFMNKMMKTALLGLVVAGGVILLGTIVKNNIDTMMFGLGGMLAVFIAVGAIAILGGLIGLLIKSTSFFDKQIIKFTLSLMLIAGLTISLGMLLQLGWKQALYGLGGMLVVMVSLVGIALLIQLVGGIGAQSVKAMAGVMFLMIGAMAIATLSVIVGKYIEENWEYALVGFAATTLILGEIFGITVLANTAAQEAKTGILNLLICEGVILGAMAIVWATVKTGELVWNYFGTDTGTALAKVAIVFAISTAVIIGAWGVTRLANSAKKDIQKGAIALLLAEGVILASAAVTAAVIGVSLLMKKAKLEDIMLTLTVMAGIVTAAGTVAAVASRFQSTIMKGALVMALLEVLILGMVGVMYAIVMTAKAVNNLKNGWVDILFTVTSMATLVLGFTAFGAAMGALCANPVVLTALVAGAAVLGTLSLLIAAVTNATMLVVKLAQMMDKENKTAEDLGTLLHSISKGVFTYENLNPGIGGGEALRLAGKFFALLPVFDGMSMMIRVVSNMARQFGGMVEVTNAKGEGIGKYGIRPFYGMNGDKPIYGEPVYIPEIATQIVESVRIFGEILYNGFKGIDTIRLRDIGLTVGYLVDPVSKFAQMLTGLTNGKQEGTLRPVIVTNDGEIKYGAEVKVVEVATLIASSVSAFASTLYGNGTELPQWMLFTRNRRGRNRIENAMNTLSLIVEPVDNFVQLLTSYQTAGDGNIRKIVIDDNGNIKTDAPFINVLNVATAIAGSIDAFASTIFGENSKWMKNFKRVDNNGETRGLRAMKSLALVVSPISSFVDALSALDPEGDKLYSIKIDDNGVVHKRPLDIVNTAVKIAESISTFVETLFGDDNVQAWKNMITATSDGWIKELNANDESSGGAVGVLSIVIDPISNFVNALSTIGGEQGENGELVIPIYDSNGKIVDKRHIDLKFTAESIAKSVEAFLRTLFSQSNMKIWNSLIYGYNADGTLGTMASDSLQKSIGVFAAVIDPVVKFMTVITKFGGTPDKFQIFDGDKPRTINLTEVANSISSAITAFMNGIKPAFDSITDFDDIKKQTVEGFSKSIGSILENFAKIGETKKEQIDLATSVIDTYFETVTKISTYLNGDLPDIKVMTSVETAMLKGKSMFNMFDDVGFDKLNYKNGFESLIDIFTNVKTIMDIGIDNSDKFPVLVMEDFVNAGNTLAGFLAKNSMLGTNDFDVVNKWVDAISLIGTSFEALPFIDEANGSKQKLWYIGAYIDSANKLKQITVSDVNLAANAAVMIDLVTQIGISMEKLSAMSVKDLDALSKTYESLFSRVLKASSRNNRDSVKKMNDIIKESTARLLSLDKQIIDNSDKRKKKLDELIETVGDFNEKLEKTSESMRDIVKYLKEIGDVDENKMNRLMNGNSAGSAGQEETPARERSRSGRLFGSDNDKSAPGNSLTIADIQTAIGNALDDFMINMEDNMTIAIPNTNGYTDTENITIQNFSLRFRREPGATAVQ